MNVKQFSYRFITCLNDFNMNSGNQPINKPALNQHIKQKSGTKSKDKQREETFVISKSLTLQASLLSRSSLQTSKRKAAENQVCYLVCKPN